MATTNRPDCQRVLEQTQIAEPSVALVAFAISALPQQQLVVDQFAQLESATTAASSLVFANANLGLNTHSAHIASTPSSAFQWTTTTTGLFGLAFAAHSAAFASIATIVAQPIQVQVQSQPEAGEQFEFCRVVDRSLQRHCQQRAKQGPSRHRSQKASIRRVTTNQSGQ
jgi:hypothetical protein